MASSYNATSGRYDPSKIQPKFRDCAFASDKNMNNFAQWTKLISGIIRNITGGAPLEAFLDQFLGRKVSQATRPSFLNDPMDDLSHEIRGDEVKILIDVKGDDREILNNIEGDISIEIRRGKVKILNNMEGDLSDEIRDVSTAFLQSDLYPDCMIKHILETLDVEDDNLETLDVEDDNLETLDVEDDNLETLDTVKGDNIKTLVSI